MTVGRRGVSLLEVLISIFVLSLGLLGVAAVIPVGRHMIREAAKSDRASACGHAVLNDIKVRGMLRPGSWRAPTGDALGCLTELPPSGYGSQERGYLLGESYAIDSMYIGIHLQPPTGSTADHWNDFPYNVAAPGTPVVPGRLGRWTRLQRVTWTGVQPPPGRPQLGAPLAATVFQWHDDLLIPVSSDETERPAQYMLTDPRGGEWKAEIAGDYSWLATVSPAAETYDFVNYFGDPSANPPELPDYLPYVFPRNAPLYDVSVAVFYKRDFTVPGGDFGDEPPAERQVVLHFLGGGIGGGDVRLFPLRRSSGVLAPGGDPDAAEYLDVKKNEWMMVSGYFPYHYFNDAPAVMDGAIRLIGVHKWYRIVAAGETASEDINENDTLDAGEDLNNNDLIDSYRDVTLDGPDWNPRWGDWDDNGAPDAVLATLLSGVIGVYTTTIEME
jgi:hypothetical protein